MIKKIVLLSIALIVVSAQNVYAAGYITVGSKLATDGGTSVSTGNTAFIVHFESNRSYACSIQASEAGDNLDFSSVTDPSAAAVSFTEIGNVTPVILADSSNDPDNRISLTPTGSGTQVSGQYTMIVRNDGSGAATGRIDCLETTLYGGYNTNVNDFNYLEISNLTNSTISGTITAINFDGTTVIDRQAFSVSANNRTDVDLHTAAGADKFGQVRVTHNGPYGALQAAVSQYSGVVGNFQLSASIPLRPRDQNL